MKAQRGDFDAGAETAPRMKVAIRARSAPSLGTCVQAAAGWFC